MEMKFEELIGKKVFALIPIVNAKTFQQITIHGVEVGGLWVESQQHTKLWLENFDLPAIQTPLFFVPYHEIRFVVHRLEKLELSEEKFGV
jgi:hypothetical protein